MEKKKVALNELIKIKFRDSKGALAPVDYTYEQVSKIGYEKYVGHDRGKIRLFFFSDGSTRNNKPYILDGRTLEEYQQFSEMLEACMNDVEALFSSDLPVQDNPFTKENDTKFSPPFGSKSEDLCR